VLDSVDLRFLGLSGIGADIDLGFGAIFTISLTTLAIAVLKFCEIRKSRGLVARDYPVTLSLIVE
jgi:hypothetical protein